MQFAFQTSFSGTRNPLRGRQNFRFGRGLVGLGLVVFFICALYTHLRAGDYSSQFGLAIGFLLLNVAALVLVLGTADVSAHGLR